MNARSRRQFLRGMGLSTAALPFIPTLAAQAGEEAPPKRLLLIYTPDGTVHDRWVPSGSETSFSLNTIMAPLSPWKDRVVILDGVTLQVGGDGEDHARNMAGLWTGCRFNPIGEDGWADGPSVDQHVASALQSDTAFSSVELAVQPYTFGVSGAEAKNRMIYTGSNAPVTPEHDPSAAFDRLFATASTDQAELDALRARRGSTIDVVKAELAELGPRLGAEDRHRLDKHLHGIRSLEQALDNFASCPTEDPAADLDGDDESQFPQVGAAQMELITHAFACDLTRVASLQWAHAGARGTRHLWLGIDEYHHILVHSGIPDVEDRITDIEVWYHERFADLLALLDSVTEPDGSTLLENTLVVWGRDLGRGYGHNRTNTPFVLAGEAGGSLDTGRFLQCGDAQHNRLLVSICQKMGLDDETFGGLDDGSGPMPGV